MKTQLAAEASEFGAVAKAALEAVGGDGLAATMTDRAVRERVVGALGALGAWDLAPLEDADQLEAAAALCRSAGYWALPYPVAERLARLADHDAVGLSVIGGVNPAAPIAGLDLPWAVVSLDGAVGLAAPRPGSRGARIHPSIADLDVAPLDRIATPTELALALALPCWSLLGMLDRAVEVTATYVAQRQQFGQPLSSFQSVQFQLTEAEVERAGVEMLAAYAVWSIETGSTDAVADALALRLAALEAADTAFRVCHQLHGAIGFCDETTISWLSRNSQPIRRLPLSLPATQTALAELVGPRGLSGLFDDLAP